MFCNVSSGGIRGINGYIVKVETDISAGMPMFELVGHLNGEVKEASQRVRTALKNTGIDLPVARITVNLAPGDIRKSGTGYDLAIALSILACMEIVDEKSLDNTFIIGELMLSGKIAAIRGVLPMLIAAKNAGYSRCIIPSDNGEEGKLVDDIEVIGVSSIDEVVKMLKHDVVIKPYVCNLKERLNDEYLWDADFENVKGQMLSRRGIEIAAAGLHNILMVGPPGAGKTMLSRCIPSILPPLSEKECLEVSSIYSVKGALSEKESIVLKRPFVSVHHAVTDIGLVGGGVIPRPGAVSLAHNGVLFLDELPEFSRKSLEALRQPLEDGAVNITRNSEICKFPSNCMLVAAMNPCPCGYHPDKTRCTCSDSIRSKYMAKISGPLLDRIDICITTQKLSPIDFDISEKAENSASIRERVIKAHQIERERFKNTNISFNSQMNNKDIEKYCVLGTKEKAFIQQVVERNDLSARSYYRILKLARTIADLEGGDMISYRNLSEAVQYKCGLT